MTHGQIETIDVQAVVTIETIAVEAVVVYGEQDEVDNEPQEAHKCEQIWRQPIWIEFHAPIPKWRHDIARQWRIVNCTILDKCERKG